MSGNPSGNGSIIIMHERHTGPAPLFLFHFPVNTPGISLLQTFGASHIHRLFFFFQTREDAKKFRNSFPSLRRQNTVIYIYLLEYCVRVLPSERHRPQAKYAGKTNHIKCFNNTVRQRGSRACRKIRPGKHHYEKAVPAIPDFFFSISSGMTGAANCPE